MKSSKQTILDFNEEQWKPPEKEDRDLRTNFYGPLTNEMMRRSLAGNNEDDEDINLTKKEEESNQYRKESRANKIVHLKENCEYFMIWEEKTCATLPIVNDDEDDDPDAPSMESLAKSHQSNYPTLSMRTQSGSSVSSVLTTQPTVNMRLICFAWAGGNASIFEKLSLKVKSALCVGVIYPGRLNRCRETLSDIRESAQETAVALVARGHVDFSFSFLGHGMGAVFAYEVAMYLRHHYKKQPDLFFAVQAPGPQSFTDDEDFDMDGDDSDGAGSNETKVEFWEENDETLYEHVMTLERGAIHEEADNKRLFNLGVTSFRSDLKALASFRYQSDWPLARPLYLVVAHYDGRISRDALRTWERETTKELRVYEMCCDGRSMLREDVVVAEFAEWIDLKVEEELSREKDPEEDALDNIARGVA